MATMAASSSSESSSNSSGTKSDLGQVSEKVRKCIRALEAAETDTEKLATLFLVPKLVRGAECSKDARLGLMKGIGYSFLARMLRSNDSPDGCPKLMFQSVALSVLSCFSQDEEIMTHPSVLFNLPVILEIITSADDEAYEENLMIIKDAYICLNSVVAYDKGRMAFINNRGMQSLSIVITKQIFQFEDASELLLNLLLTNGHLCWAYHNAFKDFNDLMGKLCTDFANSQDENKFEMCDTIRTVLRSYPKASFQDEGCEWMLMVQQGLHDILFSRLGKKQRDPAMMLVASVLEVSDFQWCLNNYEPNEDDEAKDEGRFFFVILNMACIEVIMHLEEQNMEIITENSELLVACFFIIESAVSYLSNPDNQLSGILKQRRNIQQALDNAFAAILKFLHDLSLQKDLLQKIKHFVCATIRILGAWLSEETQALRDEVYDIIPFIFQLATETFEVQKSSKLAVLPGRTGDEFTSESALTSLQNKGSQATTPDTLRFLIPAMCHLVAEDKPRKIILDMKMHETLFTYLSYHWSIFDSFRQWLKAQVAEQRETEPSFMRDCSTFELTNSKFAMVTICNVLMNVTVLEPDFVGETQLFFQLLKFIMNSLPTLENSGDQMVLYGNFSILGLLVLKHHNRKPKSTEFSVYKFIQAVIRFLWDAHNVDESPDEDEYSVSINYLPCWNDLIDLWYLGMQVLSSLLTQLPWISEFIIESGWAQEIIMNLTKVRRGGLDIGVKAAFDDLLSSLIISGGPEVMDEFKKCGVIQVCQTHMLKELARAIAASALKNSKK